MVLNRAHRWAYFSDQCKNDRIAREHEAFQAIQHCGKWSYAAHTHNGVKGVLAFWGSKIPPGRDELTDSPKKCDTGLLYFAPNPIPTQKELGKSSPYPSVDILTHSGRQLSIPLAVGAPRLVSFTGYELGDFVDDFPAAAGRIESIIQNARDDDEDLQIDNKELLDLVCLALQQTYSVTPDLLNDLGWITSVDIIPIVQAVLGADPKASGGDNVTSNLSPQESNETDNLLQENGA